MDKSWMYISNRSNEYNKGVRTFMAIAQANAHRGNMIMCSCRRCCNNYFKPIATVNDHLFIVEIDSNYTKWIFHEEEELLDITTLDDSKNVNVFGEYIDEMDDMSNDLQAGAFWIILQGIMEVIKVQHSKLVNLQISTIVGQCIMSLISILS